MRSSVVRPIASVRSRGAAVFQEGSARFTVARRQTLRLPSSVLSAHYQPGTLNVLVNHRSGCSYLRPRFLPSCGSFDAKFDRLNRRNLDNLAGTLSLFHLRFTARKFVVNYREIDSEIYRRQLRG